VRFVVIGTSGSGKSTFARALAEARRVPYVELDELFWLPNWAQRDKEDFCSRTVAATNGESWVVDGNYSAVRAVLWPRATHIVWLNFGRLTVFSRIIRRTLVRAATRQELWAGNRETFHKAFLSRESILLWSFSTFGKNRLKYSALRASPGFAHLTWHELRRPSEAHEFLQAHKRDA
jgi:adenylate kinase family enzyme